ncbi:MAG: DMT family transporter [Reyranella sp.]|nr:DMT family transporter [Reyranella sp.]MBL6652286.1 DMT family transporter [Reyranella sp.]
MTAGTGAARSNNALGALFAMLATLCYAGMDSISKFLVADHAVGQIMWIRCALIFLVSWFIVRRQGLSGALRTTRPWLQVTRSLILIVESAIFVLAFRYLPLADTHAVAATSPLIVIALGVLFLGEKAGPARWLAVAAGFIGVLLIIRPGLRSLDWPVLLPLIGALLWASYQILTRLAARHDSPDTSLIWAAMVPLIATTFVGPIGWQWPTLTVWLLLALISAIGAVGNYAMIKALDHAEAAAVQPYNYTLLLWATLFGFLMFGDMPDRWTILGAAIVVASGLYTWHHDRRTTSAATP